MMWRGEELEKRGRDVELEASRHGPIFKKLSYACFLESD